MVPSKLLIINYHKIENNRDFGITTRHPDDFCDDLDFLINAGYTSITFNNLLNDLELPSKPVLITFDDAYLSFYENAYQSLLRRDMRAVVFVPVEYIGKSNDWDVQLFGKNYMHMDESQLRTVCQNGIEIGSHTLRHRYLNNLADHILEQELKESKTKLEKITNSRVLAISYPFGRFNKRVLLTAKKYYKFGVQQMHKPQQSLEQFSLQRINIYRSDTRESFLNKLDYHSNKTVRFTSRILQLGSWATIMQQKLK